jgi:hypothetical protein
MKISDTRLFKITKHIQSFSFPQSKKIIDEETNLWVTTPTIQQTFETIEILTKEKTSNEFTQIEAKFELSKVIINNKILIEFLFRLFRLIYFLKRKKMIKNIHFFVFHLYQYVYKHLLKDLILNLKHH